MQDTQRDTPRATPRAEAAQFRVKWDVKLGAGGLAIVYLGVTEPHSHPVAIKLQREEYTTDLQVGGRFIREAQIGLLLSHPNVVTTRAFYKLQGRCALVLDLVGPSVRELREMIAGDWDVLRCIARDGASALTYLAREGVVHRDLSASNLLVDPRGVAKLSDFGMSTRYDGMPTPNAYGGTWAYLCPERLAGERGTAASDAFSFGVLLYELATGSVPFGANQESITAALPLGAPRLPDEVPRDLRAVIGGLLELDPPDRLLACEIDTRLVPERHEARERLGKGPRMWWRARCPGFEHPTERVHLYGGGAAAPRAERQPAVSHSVPLDAVSHSVPLDAVSHSVPLDREPRQRRWVPTLAAIVLPAAAGAAGSWGVLELREANVSTRRAAVDIAPPSTPASTPTAGVTVRLPDSPSASGLSPKPGDSATDTATPTLDAPGWPPGANQVVERGAPTESPSLPGGRAARGDARAGLEQLANALQNHKQLHNLPGGSLLLSPGVWRGDDVEFRFELLGGQLLDHVLVFGSHTGEAKATIAFSDRGGVITVKTVRGGEHLRIYLADVDGRYAELAGVEVPTRE